jgi:glyoxylase-like metal-dependent hydrolase (beta-lactamase superfamily II)
MRPRELGRSLAVFAARTPTLPPATHTNSYALGSREVLLVEPATPYDDERRAWVAWVRAMPATGRVPVAIVVTHHHVDHVGGAAFLSKELGIPLWAHAETATRLDAPVDRLLTEDDVLQLEGPVPERWRVLHTPGHAPGHVCLFEENERVVVVGDMVASVGTILIAPGDGHMATYLAQLERLAALDAAVALPAHGEPIETPATLLRRYVSHRLLRETKVARALEAFAERGATASELVSTAYDDTPPHVWPIAMISVEAHLEKLIEEGRAILRENRYHRAIP